MGNYICVNKVKNPGVWNNGVRAGSTVTVTSVASVPHFGRAKKLEEKEEERRNQYRKH